MNSLWDIRIFLGLVPKESLCINIQKKIATNICYSASCYRVYKVVSRTCRILSSSLTCNLQSSMPPRQFNKKLAECEWLTKLTDYVCYDYKYIPHIPMYTCIYFYIFYNKLWKTYRTIVTKWIKIELRTKSFFKLWTQCKGENSNIEAKSSKIVTHGC